MSSEKESLPRRRLGRTELDVTILSMGGAGIGQNNVSDAEAVDTVHRAVDHGMNYIDTSPKYGESERRVGLALAGGRREDVYLATKTGTHPQWRGDYSAEGTRRSVENSLRVLGTDYLDVCLVHDPESMDPVLAENGALAELGRMREKGMVRFIGLGTRKHEFHRLAIEEGGVDVILPYLDYNLINQSAATWLLPLAHQYDVGVINGSPLGRGMLTGVEPDPAAGPGPRKAYHVWQWAQEHDYDILTLALQFVFRQPLIHTNLTGARNPDELEQDIVAAKTPVPPEVWDELPLG